MDTSTFTLFAAKDATRTLNFRAIGVKVREAFIEHLTNLICDGSIQLVARSWAVKSKT